MRWVFVRDRETGKSSWGVVSGDRGSEAILCPNVDQDEIMGFVSGGTSDPDLTNGVSVSLSDFRYALLPPVERTSKILCVGLNYAAHVDEFVPKYETDTSPALGSSAEGKTASLSKEPSAAKNGRANSTRAEPLIFAKLPSSLVGSGPLASIVLPSAISQCVDYEGELAVVIGKTCHRCERLEDAAKCVLGYTAANDVTARDCQKNDKQWIRAKGMDTFCPLGPFLLTPDELQPADKARAPQHCSPVAVVRCRVNGELRQSAPTTEMIHSPLELVHYCSQFCTLFPGDVILTGTPAGVGMAREPPVWLKNGDRVTIEIETPAGFTMALQNSCIDESISQGREAV